MVGGLYNDNLDTWENKGRVEEVCDVQLKSNYGRRYPVTEKFTVILNLSRESISLNYLNNLLRMYASSKKVAQIYIHGNSVNDETGHKVVLDTGYLRALRLRKPVKVIPEGQFESANNRFNPIQGINTNSVLIADENVR
jgi:hypothetical protein